MAATRQRRQIVRRAVRGIVDKPVDSRSIVDRHYRIQPTSKCSVNCSDCYRTDRAKSQYKGMLSRRIEDADVVCKADVAPSPIYGIIGVGNNSPYILTTLTLPRGQGRLQWL